MGFHLCLVGWLDNGTAGYPTAYPNPSCGSSRVGIVDYGSRSNLSETWDAFCYREKGEWCQHFSCWAQELCQGSRQGPVLEHESRRAPSLPMAVSRGCPGIKRWLVHGLW